MTKTPHTRPDDITPRSGTGQTSADGQIRILLTLDETDTYYEHAEALHQYIYFQHLLDGVTFRGLLKNLPGVSAADAHLALFDLDCAIRATDPRAPGGGTTETGPLTVHIPYLASDVFYLPFRYALDSGLLPAGQANEPEQVLGTEAYETLAALALKIAAADPRIARIAYESPGPLRHREPVSMPRRTP